MGSGAKLATIRTTADILAVALSPSGDAIAVGRCDGTVGVWSIPSGTRVGTMRSESAPVRALNFHPDGGLLATGNDDGVVRLWNVPGEKGGLPWTAPTRNRGSLRQGAIVSLDGLIIFVFVLAGSDQGPRAPRSTIGRSHGLASRADRRCQWRGRQ